MPAPAERSDRRRRPGPDLTLLVLAAALALGGCSSSGERAAGQELDATVDSLVREAEQHYRRASTDPVWLARWAANDSGSRRHGDGQAFQVAVEPLAWRSPDGCRGELEIRIRVQAEDYRSTSVGSTSYAAGSAEECRRITVGDWPTTDQEIECAGRTPAAVPPPPPPLPPLDGDALRRALRQPSLAGATAAARRTFPGADVQGAEVDGTWAVVVRRSPPDDAECLGGTRTPDGSIRVSGVLDPQPGEGECDLSAFLPDR